jgi:hypothetical protein
MPSPTLQDYIDAANHVYLQTTSSAPPGLTLLDRPDLNALQKPSDGFYAQVFRDTSGNLIIAFEGTNDNLPGAMAANDAIAKGQTPQAFRDAIAFTRQVFNDQVRGDLPSGPIYVTGHSLGGAEAEAVAADPLNGLVYSIQGGVTFGAPGLPNYFGTHIDANFTNYVDKGDPVGNYAADASSNLSALAKIKFGSYGGNGNHYSTVVLTGLNWTGIDDLNFVGAYRVSNERLLFHEIENYASDLGLLIKGAVPIIPQQLYTNFTSSLAELSGSRTLPVPNGAHPVITAPSNVSANTNSVIPLSSLFPATETPAGSTHHIDHYSIINVSGTGSIILNGQSYSIGSVLTDISPAQFATASFSAGPNAGASEIAVIAFDDAGTGSNEALTTITVTAPATPPQPINQADHTPPTIVPPTQQLVIAVGGNPDLTSAFLNVTDANSAHYTASQLTYTIVSAPSHGYLLKGGSIVSSFSQADINNRLVEYQEDGTIASSDGFTYFVADPAGNRTSNTTFNITINAPPTSTHPTLDANSALSVGQGQTALITAANLHVADSGVNPWQIIYTMTGGSYPRPNLSQRRERDSFVHAAAGRSRPDLISEHWQLKRSRQPHVHCL